MEILDQLAKFAQQLFVVSLPVLAAFVAAFISAKIREIKLDNRIGYILDCAAEFAVKAAEQYLKSKDGQEKKAYAIGVAQRYLLTYGIKLDVALIADAIEAAVFTEFNQDKKE